MSKYVLAFVFLNLATSIGLADETNESNLSAPNLAVEKSSAATITNNEPTSQMKSSVFLNYPSRAHSSKASIGFESSSVESGGRLTLNNGMSSFATFKGERTDYGFAYKYRTMNSFVFGLESSFEKASASQTVQSPEAEVPQGTNSYSSTGMRNMNLSLAKLSSTETSALIYGLAASFNPSPSQKGLGVSVLSSEVGSSISPFVAYESKIGAAIAGTHFIVALPVGNPRVEAFGFRELTRNPRGYFTASLYYEFPVVAQVGLGALGAMSSNEQVIDGSQVYTYTGEIYSGINLPENTEIKISGRGMSRQEGTNAYAETILSAELRKSL